MTAERSAERPMCADLDFLATQQESLAGAAGFEPANAGTKNRPDWGYERLSLRNGVVTHRQKSNTYSIAAECFPASGEGGSHVL